MPYACVAEMLLQRMTHLTCYRLQFYLFTDLFRISKASLLFEPIQSHLSKKQTKYKPFLHFGVK